jgi:transposase
MTQLSADAKYHILLEYRPRSPTHSFAALAARHNVKGGKQTLYRWHRQWDGTARSLQRKEVSGRPRILSRAQVSRHVRAPILAANRAHRTVHYTNLLPSVLRRTGKQLTLRTLQRYGKEELGARQKHTRKRTTDESE